ncbi:O-antigen ligase family protein [Gordonia hongkongensis]|uniref:O-antigen ligase family protein n=1 Tax=Gordonia hongkongensis TaxID=1701090 RepID=A0ABT6BP99_9ACTN|nr:O-antigen ligase family protein [Gordonia hongkongensis]MDF6099780.1 O-antigen ligase family protein [Gordonia hongkongensis]
MTRVLPETGSPSDAVPTPIHSVDRYTRPADGGWFIQWSLLGLFAMYAFLHVIYTAGYASANTYYASFALLLVACAVRMAWVVVIRRRSLGEIHFIRSFGVLVGASMVLVIVSWIEEYSAFEMLTWTASGQVFYILAPALIALCVVNTASAKLLDLYVLILLTRYLLYFVLAFSSDLSLSSLTTISWSSSSSPFESSFAHDLLIIEAYFVFRNRKVLALISAGMTMLSLKRASFLLAPALLVGSRWLRSERPASRRYLYALAALGVASPFMVMYAYSPRFVEYMSDRFGIDMNTITTGRLEIYQVVTGILPETTGFGSLNQMLATFVDSQFGTQWNSLLHNDTLRVYLEVGIIGFAAYMCALVYLGRGSRIAALLITYTVFVLITSRLITHTSYWVVLFLVIALVERWIHERKVADRQEGSDVDHELQPR